MVAQGTLLIKTPNSLEIYTSSFQSGFENYTIRPGVSFTLI